MPAYGTFPNSKSIYPGQNALAIGKELPNPAPSGFNQNENVTTGYKSIPICVAAGMGNHGFTQRQITWQFDYNNDPSVVSWQLQGAIDDVGGDYVQVDTSTSISNFSQTVASNYRFFRLYAVSVTGVCSGLGKITCM